MYVYTYIHIYIYIYIYIYTHIHKYKRSWPSVCQSQRTPLEASTPVIKDGQTYPKRFLPELNKTQ